MRSLRVHIQLMLHAFLSYRSLQVVLGILGLWNKNILECGVKMKWNKYIHVSKYRQAGQNLRCWISNLYSLQIVLFGNWSWDLLTDNVNNGWRLHGIYECQLSRQNITCAISLLIKQIECPRYCVKRILRCIDITVSIYRPGTLSWNVCWLSVRCLCRSVPDFILVRL